MDLLQSMAMDSSMLKWGCRKKCTLRLPVEGEVNDKHVYDVGEEGDPSHPRSQRQQPRQEKAGEGDVKKEQAVQQHTRLILRIKRGEGLTFITKEEKSAVPKPRRQPPRSPSPLPELVDEDDQDWKEGDEEEDTKRTRSKRKRKSTEEDAKTKKKEIEGRPRPEFLFRLTQEQVAEDFELFTGRGHSRRSLRRRPNFDVLCPSSSLPRVFTKDRYSLQMK